MIGTCSSSLTSAVPTPAMFDCRSGTICYCSSISDGLSALASPVLAAPLFSCVVDAGLELNKCAYPSFYLTLAIDLLLVFIICRMSFKLLAIARSCWPNLDSNCLLTKQSFLSMMLYSLLSRPSTLRSLSCCYC